MINYKLAVLFAVLTVCLGNSMQSNVGDSPQRCCLPEQFSSTLTTSVALKSGDSPMLSYGHYNFSYDHNRGLFAARGTLTIPLQLKIINIRFIETTTGAILYTYYPDTKHCDVSTKTPQLTCLPDGSSFMFSSFIREADKVVNTDTWLYSTNETINYATFTRYTCFPLSKIEYGSKSDIITTSMISDLTPTIRDPSLFDIPSECVHLM